MSEGLIVPKNKTLAVSEKILNDETRLIDEIRKQAMSAKAKDFSFLYFIDVPIDAGNSYFYLNNCIKAIKVKNLASGEISFKQVYFPDKELDGGVTSEQSFTNNTIPRIFPYESKILTICDILEECYKKRFPKKYINIIERAEQKCQEMIDEKRLTNCIGEYLDKIGSIYESVSKYNGAVKN